MILGTFLARLNAALNFTSFVLVLYGWAMIKRGRQVARHRKLMQAAFIVSALFLTSYLTRFYLTGAHRFPDTGWVRTLYFAILGSHTILAIATVPLVLRSLYLGRRGRFAEHGKIAKIAFPIWAYVSMTGVVVYVMLYHVASHPPG